MATPQTVTNNYTLGRGEVYFARFLDETTKAPDGERYIGNTPEFSLTISQDVLDHFSSDHGVREKDESIALQVNRSGTLSCDNIDLENVALFFFGTAEIVADAGGAVSDEVVTESSQQGYHYQLGISASRPSGAKGLVGEEDDSNSGGAITVSDDADSNSSATPFILDTDYTFDPELGRIYIVPGGGIADGTTLKVSYTVKARSMKRVISGSQPVSGAVRFIAFNPVGDDIDYYFPYVKVSPNGDYALKSDEWQVIPFNLEILKRSDREAIYADGRPYTPS